VIQNTPGLDPATFKPGFVKGKIQSAGGPVQNRGP